jgi:hypothetical protein
MAILVILSFIGSAMTEDPANLTCFQQPPRVSDHGQYMIIGPSLLLRVLIRCYTQVWWRDLFSYESNHHELLSVGISAFHVLS